MMFKSRVRLQTDNYEKQKIKEVRSPEYKMNIFLINDYIQEEFYK